jgi:hypothetical protein
LIRLGWWKLSAQQVQRIVGATDISGEIDTQGLRASLNEAFELFLSRISIQFHASRLKPNEQLRNLRKHKADIESTIRGCFSRTGQRIASRGEVVSQGVV